MVFRIAHKRLSAVSNYLKVITDVENVVPGSIAQQRRGSSAASVSSDILETQKGRKRISKDERKAMVESFVNKYRSTNEGKFPTVSHAKKQVGGSYYVMKKILQELECKSSISFIKGKHQNSIGEPSHKGNECLTENQSSSTRTINARFETKSHMVAIQDVEIRMNGGENSEAESGSNAYSQSESTSSEKVTNPVIRTPSDLLKRDTEIASNLCTGKQDDRKQGKVFENHSDFLAIRCHLLDKEENKCYEVGRDDKKVISYSEGRPALKGAKDSENRQPEEHIEVDKLSKEKYLQCDEGEVNKKPSLWGNLKLIADGIINKWRNR